MNSNSSHFLLLLATLGLLLSPTASSAMPIAAGFNMSSPTSNPPIPVPFDSDNLSWGLDVILVFDPDSPPMLKHFMSPTSVTGAPILIDAFRPTAFPLWENFHLVPSTIDPRSRSVGDWHEEIHTPGWEWVLPGSGPFSNLFDPGQTLITRNGEPWPSTLMPGPSGTFDPTKVWAVFDPIAPPNVLDVHKALLWVGTPDNRVWGDGVNNAGETVDESYVVVWEHPTPEPASLTLMALAGGLAFVTRRRQQR